MAQPGQKFEILLEPTYRERREYISDAQGSRYEIMLRYSRVAQQEEYPMHKLIATIALILLIAALGGRPASIRAANGDLDHSFGGYGTGGRVINDLFPGTSIAAAVALPDDTLIAVGSNGQDFVVVRYDANGTLNPIFGTNGVTTLDFDGHTDVASAVALTQDGKKILVVGTTTFGPRTSPSADFAIARLNADGTPDTSFHQDGKATVDFNGRRDRATVVKPWYFDNKILLGGAVEENPPGVICAPACADDFGFALLTADGSLDSGFGSNGKAQTSFTTSAVPLAVTFDGNGRFYAAGSRANGTSTEYLIARFNALGGLDTSFNSTGYRTDSTPARLTDVVHLNDDTVLATGDAGGDFGLLRFKPNGSLFTDFGSGGMATADFGGDDSPHTLHLLSDGTFVVAGSSGTRLAQARFTDKGQIVPNSVVTSDLADTGAESVHALAVALLPDVRLWTISSIKAGNTARLALLRRFLDDSADDGGRQTTDFGADPTFGFHNDDRAQAAVFQPDGKLLVAGSTRPSNSQGSAALARYTAAGALDPSFGAGGRLILTAIPRGATDIALQPDGKIVVAGYGFNVARLKPDGSPDTSFNGTGYATANVGGESRGMAFQADGRIVLVGGDTNTFILARFTATGAPDPGFGLDGIVRTGVGLQSDGVDVAIQPDGKLIAAGATVIGQTDVNFALVRLNADGSLDPSFGSSGKVTTDFGSADGAFTVAMQPDGAILAAGVSINNGAAFARYLPDGSLDSSFNGTGKQTVQLLGDDKARALAVSATGITVVVSDQNENAGLVLRLTPSGTLDTNFNGNGRQLFSVGGTDCPFGLASELGRIAVVGYARNTPSANSNNVDHLSEDFAVVMFENVAASPSPTETPVPDATPSPVLLPDSQQVYLPLMRR